MKTRAKRTTAGEIGLPIRDEVDYEALVKDTEAFRAYLNQLIAEIPELFPFGIRER